MSELEVTPRPTRELRDREERASTPLSSRAGRKTRGSQQLELAKDDGDTDSVRRSSRDERASEPPEAPDLGARLEDVAFSDEEPMDDETRAQQSRALRPALQQIWSQIASHRDASLFRHPVTNDIAPGYEDMILRPMDLGSLKKGIETGAIGTVTELEHKMMLMFANAIMYNSPTHFVHIAAQSMRRDAKAAFLSLRDTLRQARKMLEDDAGPEPPRSGPLKKKLETVQMHDDAASSPQESRDSKPKRKRGAEP